MWHLIKHLHMLLALLSIAGFLLRGILMLIESNLLNRSSMRRLPHVVDTFLLATGVAMAWHAQFYPFVNSSWLSAKMLALLAYIGFGMIALKHGRNKVIRSLAFAIASCCGFLMIAIAMQHSPLVLA